jgi:MFS family permease
MKKSPLVIIFLIVAIDLIGFGLIIPILPYYAKSFGASATTLGFLMMSYSAMQFVFSPLWGRRSDKIGRRKVLLVCIFGMMCAMVALGCAHSVPQLFLARLLAGFFGANLSVAQAYIADITTLDQRAKGMGLIGAAFGIGFLIGPALGGVLSKWGYGMPAFVAAGLSLINLIFALVALPEPKIDEAQRALDRPRLTHQVWGDTLRHHPVALAIILFFLVTMGMAQIETSFALFLLARFGLDAYHAGLILALMALMMALIQGGSIGKLAHAFGERRLVAYGSFVMVASLLGISFSTLLHTFIACVVLYAVGYALANPSLASLASRFAPADAQGATMGVYQSAGSLGRILGPLIAGVLFDRLGPAVPFTAASFIFALVFVGVALRGSVWVPQEQ